MIIYKTTNVLNNNYYIGKDSRNDPHYYGSGLALKLAIKKYGKKNFIKEIIEYVDGKDLSKLLEREIYWIDSYDAINDEKSYNIQRDSGNRPKVKTKDETRKKISKAVKLAYETNIEYRKKITEHNRGETNPMFGKTQTEFQRKCASDANKGKIYSEKTRKKISEARKGKSFLTESGKQKIGDATKKRWVEYRIKNETKNLQSNL
jgi:group I intron endonuclease